MHTYNEEKEDIKHKYRNKGEKKMIILGDINTWGRAEVEKMFELIRMSSLTGEVVYATTESTYNLLKNKHIICEIVALGKYIEDTAGNKIYDIVYYSLKKFENLGDENNNSKAISHMDKSISKLRHYKKYHSNREILDQFNTNYILKYSKHNLMIDIGTMLNYIDEEY